jgi:hypothetical protein
VEKATKGAGEDSSPAAVVLAAPVPLQTDASPSKSCQKAAVRSRKGAEYCEATKGAGEGSPSGGGPGFQYCTSTGTDASPSRSKRTQGRALKAKVPKISGE